VARHGYLREYDEAPDRSDNRGEDWGESNGAFMLDRDRGRSGDDRGWRGPSVDERRGTGAYGRRYSQSQGDVSGSGRNKGGFGDRGDWERSPRDFRSRQDDHYLSWRDQQMRALDNDYAEYCRERERQFHSDFENWRRSRQHGKDVPVGEAAELELTQERVLEGEGNTPSPVSEATLGTNNSENTSPGRR
jgi:hypothetical protein